MLLIQYYIIFIYKLYKYHHYNYHWKDLQYARTIEMRSHYKKLAYRLRGSVMNSQVVLSLEIFAVHHPLLIDETYSKIILSEVLHGTGA